MNGQRADIVEGNEEKPGLYTLIHIVSRWMTWLWWSLIACLNDPVLRKVTESRRDQNSADFMLQGNEPQSWFSLTDTSNLTGWPLSLCWDHLWPEVRFTLERKLRSRALIFQVVPYKKCRTNLYCTHLIEAFFADTSSVTQPYLYSF